MLNFLKKFSTEGSCAYFLNLSGHRTILSECFKGLEVPLHTAIEDERLVQVERQ